MPPDAVRIPHVLGLANRTCPCPELHGFVHAQLPARPARITVVAPALNDSRLAHFVSDTGKAVAAAAGRLEQAIEGLTIEGVTVTGRVGDAKPITALEDALAQDRVDLIVLATFPRGKSHWLESGLREAVDELGVPVRHFMTEYGLDDSPDERVATRS